MADSLKLFGRVEVYINGRFLKLETDVSVQTVTNDSQQNTRGMGFAGVRMGSAVTNITVTSAVPGDDFEYDPGEDCLNRNEVEIWVFMGGKTLKTSGFILDFTNASAVDGDTNSTFTMLCRPARFE